MGKTLPGLTALLALSLLTGPGCIWEDRCTEAATRVEGRCVLVDAGSASDGAVLDGEEPDASPDAMVLADGCVVERHYRDEDEDTWGDPEDTVDRCNPPAGYVGRGGDCDDATGDVHPEAAEACNSVDDDCDGRIDEGLLEPDASAVSLGDADVGTDLAVTLAGFSGGYIAAWERDDSRIVYETVDTAGTSLIGVPNVLDSAGSAQEAPSVAVLHETSPPAAVIAFLQGDLVRARVVPLDGSTLPPAIDLATDSTAARPLVVGAGSEALVVWLSQSGARSVQAARVDGASGDAIGTPTAVYEYVNPPVLLFHWASFVPAPASCLMVGVADRRAGDLLARAYAACAPHPALSMTAPGWLEQPAEGAVAALMPMVDGSGGVLMAALSGVGADANLETVAVTPGPPIEPAGGWSAVDPGGVPVAWAPLSTGGILVHVDGPLLTSGEGEVRAAFLDDDGSPTDERSWFTITAGLEGLAVASSDGRSAVLTAIPSSTTASVAPVEFRELTCDP